MVGLLTPEMHDLMVMPHTSMSGWVCGQPSNTSDACLKTLMVVLPLSVYELLDLQSAL